MAEQKAFQATPTGATSATSDLSLGRGDDADALERQKLETRQQAEQIKAGARETAEEVRRKGAEMAHEAKETARDLKDRAVHSAAETAQQVQHRAMSLADQQKSRLASELTTFGEAVSRAADKLREDNDQRVAGYADLAANELRSMANYLSARNCGELLGDVENFARRRPEVFFGGMLLAGLGIARFLKASRRPRQPIHGDEYDQFDDQYRQYGGQGQDYGREYPYASAEQSRPTYAGGMYGQPPYGEPNREEGSYGYGSSFDRSSTAGSSVSGARSTSGGGQSATGPSSTGQSTTGQSSFGQSSAGASGAMAPSGLSSRPSMQTENLQDESTGCECPPTPASQFNQEAFPESKEPAKGETEKNRSMNDPLSYH